MSIFNAYIKYMETVIVKENYNIIRFLEDVSDYLYLSVFSDKIRSTRHIIRKCADLSCCFGSKTVECKVCLKETAYFCLKCGVGYCRRHVPKNHDIAKDKKI